MTAHDTSGDRKRCLAAGMDGCIAKPLRIEELTKSISHFAVVGAVEPATVSASGEDTRAEPASVVRHTDRK